MSHRTCGGSLIAHRCCFLLRSHASPQRSLPSFVELSALTAAIGNSPLPPRIFDLSFGMHDSLLRSVRSVLSSQGSNIDVVIQIDPPDAASVTDESLAAIIPTESFSCLVKLRDAGARFFVLSESELPQDALAFYSIFRAEFVDSIDKLYRKLRPLLWTGSLLLSGLEQGDTHLSLGRASIFVGEGLKHSEFILHKEGCKCLNFRFQSMVLCNFTNKSFVPMHLLGPKLDLILHDKANRLRSLFQIPQESIPLTVAIFRSIGYFGTSTSSCASEHPEYFFLCLSDDGAEVSIYPLLHDLTIASNATSLSACILPGLTDLSQHAIMDSISFVGNKEAIETRTQPILLALGLEFSHDLQPSTQQIEEDQIEAYFRSSAQSYKEAHPTASPVPKKSQTHHHQEKSGERIGMKRPQPDTPRPDKKASIEKQGQTPQKDTRHKDDVVDKETIQQQAKRLSKLTRAALRQYITPDDERFAILHKKLFRVVPIAEDSWFDLDDKSLFKLATTYAKKLCSSADN